MLEFTPYVLNTLWRHRTRTLLTVSGAAVALFVFSFVGSIQQGLDDLPRRRAGESRLVVFQANKFCPATSHLPEDYDRRIGELPGVREVVPIQVFTNNCRASLDVVVFYGLPAEKLRRVRDFELVEGNWNDFLGHQDAAVVGRTVFRRLARQRGTTVGGNYSLGEHTVTVAGVFTSDDPAEENHIYTHLGFLQRGRRESFVGTVTQFEVLLAEGVTLEAACRAVDDELRGGPVATATRPKGVFQAKTLGDLAELAALSRWLGLACVGLVLVLVGTTTLMAVEDRVAEHAVLQTLGFSGPRVFLLILSETILVALAGGLLGVGLANAGLAVGGLGLGAEAVTIALVPSFRLAATGLGVALLTGVLAGFVPAWRGVRTEIVPALRQG